MSSSFSEFTQPGKKPVVNSIFDFSAEALGEIRLWLEQNPPAVPITSVLGFSQFTATTVNLASVTDTTTSATPVDPPTHGVFQLSGLSAGNYLVLVAGDIKIASAGATTGRVILFANGVTTNSEIITGNANFVSACAPTTVRLANAGSNTLSLKMQSDDGLTVFSLAYRAIVALRYSNL